MQWLERSLSTVETRLKLLYKRASSVLSAELHRASSDAIL